MHPSKVPLRPSRPPVYFGRVTIGQAVDSSASLDIGNVPYTASLRFWRKESASGSPSPVVGDHSPAFWHNQGRHGATPSTGTVCVVPDQPEKCAADEEGLHLMPAIIEDQALPFRVKS